MKRITIYTDDGIVWHKEKFLIDLFTSMHNNEPIVIDTNTEGPDLATLDIYPWIESTANAVGYDLTKITVYTANQYEKPPAGIQVEYVSPDTYLNWAKTQTDTPRVKTFSDKFKSIGCFISRGNWHRLKIANHLWQHHRSRVIQSYHYNHGSDYHKANIGIEEFVHQTGFDQLDQLKEFMSACPLKLDPQDQYPIVHPRGYGLIDYYQNFFAEIVCETYLQGDTFFPTEKIWRPIRQKTPFIVQGPRHYLRRLRALGFKTFSQWWDEGHDEDPYNCHAQAIEQLADKLCTLTVEELEGIYIDMQDILEHNYQVFQELDSKTLQEKLANA